jgi:hypothetical protein
MRGLTKGQILDAGHVSATRISVPKRLRIVANTNSFFSSKSIIFLELRHTSIRYNKHQKFDLKFVEDNFS